MGRAYDLGTWNIAGEIDAVMSARPPAAMGRGILRLMPDSQLLEEQYFKDTRIYPLMHSLVLKSVVLDAHLWVGMNLVNAFLEAKTGSIQRLSDVTASHAPVAWMDSYTSRMRSILGTISSRTVSAPSMAARSTAQR